MSYPATDELETLASSVIESVQAKVESVRFKAGDDLGEAKKHLKCMQSEIFVALDNLWAKMCEEVSNQAVKK